MPLNIDDNRIAMSIPPLLRLAFRPMFLFGTLFSIIIIGWWAWFWVSPFDWQPYGGPVWWHGHEMLFGFVISIVVGFLLTAVQNWTGVTGIRGTPLFILVASWLLGRLLLAFGSGLPPWMVMSGDLLFLVFSAIAMAYPVFKVRQFRNMMFAPILATLALLNGISHWGVITQDPQLAHISLHGSIMMFVLIVAIVGGRVIPFFTANRTGVERRPAIQWLEIVSLASIILLVLVAFFGLDKAPKAILLAISLIAALANAWRFMRWGGQHCTKIPLLWSLHVSYAFMPVGFFMLALYAAGVTHNLSAVLHCFTIGAMGGMILAMISRVTLGHTGRPLEPPKLIALGYIAIAAAALFRVIFSAWIPDYFTWAIAIAGGLWVLAYGIFFFYYAPMLITARADGRSG